MVKRLTILSSGLLSAALTSCGAGGGGSYTPPAGSVPPPPSTSGATLAMDFTTFQLAPTGATASANVITLREISAGTNATSAVDSVTSAGVSTVPLGSPATTRLYMGTTEVTQGQWRTLVTASGANVPAAPWTTAALTTLSDDQLPATNLSHQQITTVLTAWNTKSFYRLRLPTAVEWENAARAGTTTAWFWGDDERVATIAGRALVRETGTGLGGSPGPATVAGRLPNAWGLYDVHGNAWEWVSNGGASAAPCLRGGSWADNALSAHSGNRIDLPAAVAHPAAGFRLVLEPR
jgi:hypothetical protein